MGVLTASGPENDSEMTEDEYIRKCDKGPKIFFSSLSLPKYDINFILESDKIKQETGRRLKRASGLTG